MDEDIRELWRRWSLPTRDTIRRDDPGCDRVGSHTTLLRDVVALRTATLEMLRDVLAFLASHGASARTTGSHL